MKKISEEQLLAAALALAASGAFNKVTRKAVADHAGVSESMVNVRFGTMARFERALMRYAIRQRNLCVLAQGIALKNSYALKAPQELRDKAIENLAGAQ